VHVFSQFDGNPEIAAYLPALWDHSVAAAAIAQRIAGSETRKKAMVEESFTAGLLHEVGKVVLLAEIPREYGRVVESAATDPAGTLALERQVLGCTHAQAGAYLMSIWGLPAPLVHAVAFHHNPSECADAGFSSVTAVHVADAIVSAADALPLNHDIELDLQHLERLGLRDKEAAWRTLHEDRRAAQLEGEARERKDSVRG
jgi:HD-like signal output (HDOD) protein